MRTIILTSLTCGLVLMTSQLSLAGLIASEDFESYTPETAIAGGAGGTGWEGTWITNPAAVAEIEEHTIDYPMLIDGVAYTGGSNAVVCTGPSSVINNFMEREFPAQTDTVYFSLLFERNFASEESDIFMQFQLSHIQPTFNWVYGGAAAMKGVIDARGRGGPDSGSQITSPCTYDSDIAFIVVKLSKSSGDISDNYDTAALFINPTSSIEPTADATVAFDMETSDVKYFALRSAYFSPTNYAYVDDLRIGTDFESILPGYVPPVYVPGDANRDGKVDGSDATTLAGNWLAGVGDPDPSTITWEMGDFNGDGQIDDYDATLLATNWQASVTASAASVPEPSTLALLLAAIGSLLIWKRRS